MKSHIFREMNKEGFEVKIASDKLVNLCIKSISVIQCTISIRYICNNTKTPILQTGIRLGLSFALIYLVGMQEVFVEGSPFTEYGPEFVRYQFFMGLGDDIPAFLLCILVSRFTKFNQKIKRIW